MRASFFHGAAKWFAQVLHGQRRSARGFRQNTQVAALVRPDRALRVFEHHHLVRSDCPVAAVYGRRLSRHARVGSGREQTPASLQVLTYVADRIHRVNRDVGAVGRADRAFQHFDGIRMHDQSTGKQEHQLSARELGLRLREAADRQEFPHARVVGVQVLLHPMSGQHRLDFRRRPRGGPRRWCRAFHRIGHEVGVIDFPQTRPFHHPFHGFRNTRAIVGVPLERLHPGVRPGENAHKGVGAQLVFDEVPHGIPRGLTPFRIEAAYNNRDDRGFAKGSHQWGLSGGSRVGKSCRGGSR